MKLLNKKKSVNANIKLNEQLRKLGNLLVGSLRALQIGITERPLIKAERMLTPSSAMSREGVLFSSRTSSNSCHDAFRNAKGATFEKCLPFRLGKRNSKLGSEMANSH